jgi:hypothetical protein
MSCLEYHDSLRKISLIKPDVVWLRKKLFSLICEETDLIEVKTRAVVTRRLGKVREG